LNRKFLLGQAGAFDPALTERARQVAAREASPEGIKWAFAPMEDIARDSRRDTYCPLPKDGECSGEPF